jgi:hypothetical protein
LESKNVICQQQSNSIVVWVCSSLIVAQQLLEDWIQKLNGVEFRVICSLQEVTTTLSSADDKKNISDQIKLQNLLLCSRRKTYFRRRTTTKGYDIPGSSATDPAEEAV